MRFHWFIMAIIALFIGGSLNAQFLGQTQGIGPPGSNQQRDEMESDTLYSGREREKYSFKRYFKSLAGKDSMGIVHMWGGSMVLPGSAQLYNREYWKIPLIYGSIGAFSYAGYHNNQKWHESGDRRYALQRDLFYTGAALSLWGSVVDGLANYRYEKEPLPPRASLYSVMLPGLGQIYNGDYWKIPIIYGGFMITGYFISFNHSQFVRYKELYYESSDKESPNYGKHNPETMRYYKDSYRRYRDYSVLAALAVYLLNIVDANVFAHLQDFDISDDLTVSLSPAIINPINSIFAQNNNPAVGLRLNFNF